MNNKCTVAPAPKNTKDRDLVEALSHSRLFREYEKAFHKATGMPLAITPVETWQLALHGRPGESPFCEKMADRSRTCAACLEVQEELRKKGSDQPATMTCHLGLSDTVVPVKVGERIVGFLQTGQVFLKKPTESRYRRNQQQLNEWGMTADAEALKKAWFNTQVVSPGKHESIVQLLNIFAQHLSLLTNQILVQQEKAEPAVIVQAKEYIREHLEDRLSLGEVAKAVNTSSFYFCKLFKKVTGLNFTDYISRLRIEKARELLLNPQLRVSEIAYQVGFQSLTHFNRIFKRILGESPTEFRRNLTRQKSTFQAAA